MTISKNVLDQVRAIVPFYQHIHKLLILAELRDS